MCLNRGKGAGTQDEYPALSSCAVSLFGSDYFTEQREHEAGLTFLRSERLQKQAGDAESDVPRALR